jgi:hypothetical protein
MIRRIIHKYSAKFRVRVYQTAICGNHIHSIVLGKTRPELQNFLRVVAGQIAQEILRLYPLQKNEARAFTGSSKGTAHPKNQRSFWSVTIYSRIVSWGQEFKIVMAYVLQNTKEALGLVAYKERKRPGKKNSS